MNIPLKAAPLPSFIKELAKTPHKPANSNISPGQQTKEIGSRNNTLTSTAGFLRRTQNLPEEELFVKISALNSSFTSPLAENEVRNICKSVCRYPGGLSTQFNDVNLSRDLAKKLSGYHLCCQERGWMAFDVKVWRSDPSGTLSFEATKRFVEKLNQDAKLSSDLEAVKKAKAYLQANKVGNLHKLSRSDRALQARLSDFDKTENLLNLGNGTLNLETRTLQPHTAADRLTKIANVEFDPNAECPTFVNFIATSLSSAHRGFTQRLFGYMLLGNPVEQRFAIFHGAGANGKSTLINSIANLLGRYAATAEPSTFMKQQSTQIRNDLARLNGPRLVTASELAAGQILDAALVKRMTGDDPITARFLNQEFFEFRPKFTIFMITNSLPVINGSDKALARRIILLPFNKVVKESERDPKLMQKLADEGPGILNWLLDGLADYRLQGLNCPTDIQDAVDTYVEGADLIAGFLSDETTINAEGSAAARELHLRYRMWCSQQGLKALSQPQFKSELEKKPGISQKRKNSGVFWTGIALNKGGMGV